MSIKTKYGSGYIKDGYVRISSIKEGNFGKYLHRLIYEEHYGEIPKGHIIHHKNGNKQDNSLENLELMKLKDHVHYHVSGENNPLYGKNFSKEHRKKMSEAKKGKCGLEANNSKYDLWDSSYAILEKQRINPNNPTRCFKFNRKGKKISIGMFNEWVSCEIINDLIDEAVSCH